MNKRFFAYFAFFFYILTFSANLFAKEEEKKKDYLSMKITPEAGLLNGTINEYVYSTTCLNTDNKMSELDWELKNVPVFSLTADFDILNRAYAGLTGRFGFPVNCGNMQDYDWLNSTKAAWSYQSPTELTNYSCHDSKISKIFMVMLRVGFNLFLPAEIKLSPYIAYQYDYIGFDSFDGYTIYKSNNYKTSFLQGKVISYSHEINSILTGFKISFTKIPRTSIDGDFCFSPALTFLNAHDFHYMNVAGGYGTAYWDKFNNAWLIKAHLSIQYRFNNNHSSGISGGIEFMPGAKGVTSYKNLGQNGMPSFGQWNTTSSDSGGTKRFLWTINLNYSFSL